MALVSHQHPPTSARSRFPGRPTCALIYEISKASKPYLESDCEDLRANRPAAVCAEATGQGAAAGNVRIRPAPWCDASNVTSIVDKP